MRTHIALLVLWFIFIIFWYLTEASKLEEVTVTRYNHEGASTTYRTGSTRKFPEIPTLETFSLLKARYPRAVDTEYHRKEDDSANHIHIPRPILKPSYGVLFEHQGYLLQDLRRKYLFLTQDLPTMTKINTPWRQLPFDCKKWPAPDFMQGETEKMIQEEVCDTIKTIYAAWFEQFET